MATAGRWPESRPPPYAHFCAGATGGMIATTITSPLDIVKTRLQSTLNTGRERYQANARLPLGNTITSWLRDVRRPVRETMHIVGTIYRTEGPLALFRGLGPNLAGFVPATALKFLLYGNTKTALVALTGRENAWTHLGAGMVAGIVTCTATNPFWVIKTRLQLDTLCDPATGVRSRRYRNSLDCVKETVRREGVRALYKGLSASYIGTLETAVQWTLYEYLKSSLRSDQEYGGSVTQSAKEAISAGSSKLVAAVALYPHEVLRTRLREAPREGTSTYQMGLRQCFRTIIAKEGFAALYGGLAAHLLRAVPSSAIVFTVYEATLRLFPQQSELAT